MKFYPLSPNAALCLWWNATDSREFPSLEESEWMVIGEIYWLDDPSPEDIEDLLTVDDDNYEYEDEECPYLELFWSTFSLIRNEYFLRIQSECRRMRTRITPNTDTFYAVEVESVDKVKRYSEVALVNFRSSLPEVFCKKGVV